MARTTFEVSQMPDEEMLRDKARAAVRDGKLPSRRPDRKSLRLSVGVICAICDLPLECVEMELGAGDSISALAVSPLDDRADGHKPISTVIEWRHAPR